MAWVTNNFWPDVHSLYNINVFKLCMSFIMLCPRMTNRWLNPCFVCVLFCIFFPNYVFLHPWSIRYGCLYLNGYSSSMVPGLPSPIFPTNVIHVKYLWFCEILYNKSLIIESNLTLISLMKKMLLEFRLKEMSTLN